MDNCNCWDIVKVIFEILGSVGTLIAALIALFQPYFLNKKKASISINESKSRSLFDEKGFEVFDKCFKIEISNTGNRKICIKKIMIGTSKKNLIVLNKYEKTVNIDVDEESSLIITFKRLKESLTNIDKEKFNRNNIILYIYDSSNQIFKVKTDKTYSYFLNLKDDELVVKEKIKEIKYDLLNEEE